MAGGLPVFQRWKVAQAATQIGSAGFMLAQKHDLNEKKMLTEII